VTVAGAVVVALVFAWLWRHSLLKNGKGTAPGRLLAVLVAAIVIWGFVAVNNPSAGARVAAFTAAGTAALIGGIGHLISDL
jgi:hypothetical protein